MKIAYLTLEAARDGQASYTHIHEIIKGLKKRGWEVELFQPPYAEREISPALWMRGLFAILTQIKFWLSYKKGTVIYIRAHYLAFPTTIIAKFFAIPVVQEINGPYEDPFVTYPSLNKVKPFLIWSMRKQYQSSLLLIGVTENITEWAEKESLGRPSYTIPNGANIDLFKPNMPKPSGLPEKYVIFFGGLSRWHGIPTILEALKSPLWPSDLSLVVIGDGAERDRVEEAAKEDQRIVYLGKKPYAQMASYIGSALCGLVVISDPQGRSKTGLCPLKLYETLACGVPCIVSDFPGQADLIRDGNCGVVIAHDNAEELSRAVNNFAFNPADAAMKGQRGATLVAEHHSWDARAEATHEVLLDIFEMKPE
jgi:glycosyltransferase involved in cell wall biosynthesis